MVTIFLTYRLVLAVLELCINGIKPLSQRETLLNYIPKNSKDAKFYVFF